MDACRARFDTVLKARRLTEKIREIRRLNEKYRMKNAFDLAQVHFADRTMLAVHITLDRLSR